ncbi:MAG: cell division topological specificity factor MinE, partial [Neisseria sp.]|nr:cell division topological specificity factor MinE [Neisseria sp.]
IAQERAQEGQAPDYLPTLRKELLEVLSKYVNVSLDDIRISQEKQDGMDVLELNITLPEQKTEQKKA